MKNNSLKKTNPLKFFASIEKQKRYGGYLFLLPWIIGFVSFFAYPFIKTLLISFCSADSIEKLSHIQFTGLESFQRAFVVDTEFLPMFFQIIGDTIINTILILVFSLFVALLLNKNLPGKGVFRAVFFLPVIIGTGVLSQAIIDPDTAIAVMALDTESLTGVLSEDMAEVVTNLLGALSMVFWRSSVQMVIYLSGLQGIPDSLYEAADCDGATKWEVFWKITLPLLAPITVLNLVYTIIDSFTSADNKMLQYMYNTTFVDMNYSYGAAMSMLYLLFVLAFTVIAYICVSPKTGMGRERK